MCFVIIDFLWGYCVFDNNPHSIEEWKTNIKDAVSNIDHTLSGSMQHGEMSGRLHSGEGMPISASIVTK